MTRSAALGLGIGVCATGVVAGFSAAHVRPGADLSGVWGASAEGGADLWVRPCPAASASFEAIRGVAEVERRSDPGLAHEVVRVGLEPWAERADVIAAVRRVASCADDPAWVVGRPVVEAALTRLVLADALRVCAAALGVLAIGLGLMFRSAAVAAVPLVTVGVAGAWTLGLMAWAGQALDGPMIVVPALTLVLGVADSAQVMHRARLDPDGVGPSPERVIRAMLPANTWTSVTTALGFLSIVPVASPAMVSLAGWAAVGIGCAWVASVVVPYVALTGIPSIRRWPSPRPAGPDRIWPRPPWWALGLIGVALVAAAVRVEPRSPDLGDLPAYTPEVVDAERWRRAIGPLHAVEVQARARPGDVGALLDVDSLIRRHPAVAQVGSPGQVVRELAASSGRRPEQIALAWAEPGLRRRVPEAAYDLVADSVWRSHVGLVPDTGAWPALIRDLETYDRLDASIDLTWDGGPVAVAAELERLSRDVWWGALGSWGVVAVALAAMVGSPRQWLVALWAVLVTGLTPLAALYVANRGLTPLTAMLVAVAAGVGIDAVIHVSMRWREERRAAPPGQAWEVAWSEAGRPVLWTSSLLAAGVAALGVSAFGTVREAGLALAAGLLVNGPAALWAFTWFRPTDRGAPLGISSDHGAWPRDLS